VNFDRSLGRQTVFTGANGVWRTRFLQGHPRGCVDQPAGQQIDQTAIAHAALATARIQGHPGLPQQGRQHQLRAPALGGDRAGFIG